MNTIETIINGLQIDHDLNLQIANLFVLFDEFFWRTIDIHVTLSLISIK